MAGRRAAGGLRHCAELGGGGRSPGAARVIVVLGSRGFVGGAVAAESARLGLRHAGVVSPSTRPTATELAVDLCSDSDRLALWFAEQRPTALIHAAFPARDLI